MVRDAPDRYESFIAFAGDEGRFILRSESAADVPNNHLATLGETVEAAEGEATRAHTRESITRFEDLPRSKNRRTTLVILKNCGDCRPGGFGSTCGFSPR